MAPTLRDWALAYAQRGMRVFPCWPPHARPKDDGKRPATRHGCLDAITDAAQINAWWSNRNDFNIACATGDGLMVVDIDVIDDAGEEGGESCLRRLEERFGVLPRSVEQITGGGGRHIFLRYPKGRDVRNSAGKLGKGIDVRAGGGFVVLPPSRHESGRTYQWSVDGAKEFADAPSWLLDLLDAPKATSVVETGIERAWANVMRDGLARGSRNDGLTRLVGYWLHRIGDPAEVLELALMFNDVRCRPPLPIEEIETIVDSIASRELQKRTAL
jgi:hypothetical protein